MHKAGKLKIAGAIWGIILTTIPNVSSPDIQEKTGNIQDTGIPPKTKPSKNKCHTLPAIVGMIKVIII